MFIDTAMLAQIQNTIDSGYYERNLPRRREKKSLSEALERTNAEGRLPILIELKCADPRSGQHFSSREQAIAALDALGSFVPAGFSTWVEPRTHAGDVRWLAREVPLPILVKDYIISEKQLVGGDAALLSMPLLAAAKIDPHFLIEAAHDMDIEVVMEAYTEEQFIAAKNGEADILAINNYGHNGSPASVDTTLSLMKANSTGRPVISMEGITEPEHVRSLISAGVTAVEVGPDVWAAKYAQEHLHQLERAVGGREPANPLEKIKTVN